MTYRGKMDHGVVVLDGVKPADGTRVEVIPSPAALDSSSAHPAVGMWKDRSDLPEDSVEASCLLRQRLMHRDEPSVDR